MYKPTCDFCVHFWQETLTDVQTCNLCENMEYFEYDKRVAEYVPPYLEPISDEDLAEINAFIATL